MKRILNIYLDTNGGGVEGVVLNYTQYIKEYNFEVIATNLYPGVQEDRFVENGINVIHVPPMRQSLLHNILTVFRICKVDNIDIIHCHGYKSIFGAILPKIILKKKVIMHSHMKELSPVNPFIKCLINIITDKKIACGEEAAVWLYGEKEYKSGKVEILNNAIDVEKFSFNPVVRNKIRKELLLSGKFVLCNVGRLCYQKNQAFLLQIMDRIKDIDDRVVLLLVGDGPDRMELEEKVKKYKLEDNVKFLGIRKDIPSILSASDLFLLPSHYEGLPVSLVEVQAANLPSIVSNNVTKEMNDTGLLMFEDISEVENWISKILELKKTQAERIRSSLTQLKYGRYDIEVQADRLKSIYDSLIFCKEK